MTSEQIVTIIVAIIGSGVLSAIVSAVANRGKNDAESKKIVAEAAKVAAEASTNQFTSIIESLADTSAKLMDVAEHRIANLCDRAERLEARISQLEGEIFTLKCDILERERMIDTLKRENANLQGEVEKLQKSVLCRDKRIKELERLVAELTHRLDAMNGNQDGLAQ